MKILSFTGTRKGMNADQRALVQEVLEKFCPDVVVHGDCNGADADVHRIASIRHYGCEIWIRPCNIESQRAHCEGAAKEFEPESPLIRNHKIVDDGELLVACPSGNEEVLRSGTWATIRYARKQGKKLMIIYPNGSIGR